MPSQGRHQQFKEMIRSPKRMILAKEETEVVKFVLCRDDLRPLLATPLTVDRFLSKRRARTDLKFNSGFTLKSLDDASHPAIPLETALYPQVPSISLSSSRLSL